ncbi:MAG: phosphotransferase family protein [Promethearchaeota archaeon]
MRKIEGEFFLELVNKIIQIRPLLKSLNLGDFEFKISRQPQFYNASEIKEIYKVESIKITRLSTPLIFCLKINEELKPIQNEINAREVLKNLRKKRFYIPQVFNSSLLSSEINSFHWVAMEWIRDHIHPQINPSVLRDIAFALADYQFNQPSVSEIATIYKIKLPQFSEINSKHIISLSNHLHGIEQAMQNSLYAEISKEELDLIMNSITKLLDLLPRCNLEGLCLNHGDFHIYNIIVSKHLSSRDRLVIFDWEYSGLDSPFSDLAHFISFLTEAESSCFFHMYIEALDHYGKKLDRDSVSYTCFVLTAFYIIRHIKNHFEKKQRSENKTKRKFWFKRLHEIMLNLE